MAETQVYQEKCLIEVKALLYIILRLFLTQKCLSPDNIDLAPRISLLRPGDFVSFSGEYEWNSQGGVIHWTHRDPNGRHIAGWLEHGSKLYQ